MTEMPDADALEQRQDLDDPASRIEDVEPSTVSVETPEADAVEQRTAVGDAEAPVRRDEPRWDADEGDLAESRREVGFDDDDYR